MPKGNREDEDEDEDEEEEEKEEGNDPSHEISFPFSLDPYGLLLYKKSYLEMI